MVGRISVAGFLALALLLLLLAPAPSVADPAVVPPLRQGAEQAIRFHQPLADHLKPDAKGNALRGPAAEKRVLEILELLVDVDVDKLPLQKFLEKIERLSGLSLVLDDGLLKDEFESGVHVSVTMYARGISLQTALNRVAVEITLRDDGKLLITTREQAHEHLLTRQYDVADLVRGEAGGKVDANGNASELVDLLTQLVEPASWADDGGSGTAKVVQPNLILVLHTWDVHRQIAAQLEVLRAVKAAQKKQPGGQGQCFNGPELVLRAAAARMQRALDKRISVDFTNHPLGDVLAAIERDSGLSFELDRTALDGIEIDATTLISVHAQFQPAREVLLLLCKHDGSLKWWVYESKEQIVITTRETECGVLSQMIFPVADLTSPIPPDGRALFDPDVVSKAIQERIEPSSWEAEGGAVAIYFLACCDAFVVSQDTRLLAQLEVFLTQLRKEKRIPAGDLKDRPAPGDGAAEPNR